MVTLDEVYSRLRSLEEKHKENMFEIEKRLAKMQSGSSSVGSENIEERIGNLEDLIRLSELETIKLNERIGAGADASGIVPADLEARLENLEKNLSSGGTGTELEGIGAGDIAAKVDAVEEKITDIENATTDKLNDMNAKVNEIVNRARDATPGNLADMGKNMEKLREMEARIDAELDKRKDALNTLRNIDTEADKVNAAISQARAVEEKIRSDIEMLSTSKAEIDKRVDNALKQMRIMGEDVEQRMANAESRINSGLDKIIHTQETLDTQMARLDRKFQLIDKGGLSEDVLKNLNKKAVEYQYKINQLAEQMKGLDVSKFEKKIDDLADKIENAERRSDERSMRFLTQELENFAKVLDDKIPQLPSHSQFENIMRRIEQIDTKIMHVERPNIIPLEQRVESLSIKLDRVIDVIKKLADKMNSRMPVVVD